MNTDAERAEINRITDQIIGSAIEVHKVLGPGLLESAYEECLCYELSLRNLDFERQLSVPILYKSVKLDCGYRLDLAIKKRVIAELKAVDAPIHEAQVLTYLKLTGITIGLLINFNVPILKAGLKRIANNF
ncbi:MAG: GxxExxY protein [Anaerolineae bacterium]|nr:GxxExxY protein [Thermoflexales bacterium]HQW35536.1 GxxExxY protein [Thermoflexales bacterium]